MDHSNKQEILRFLGLIWVAYVPKYSSLIEAIEVFDCALSGTIDSQVVRMITRKFCGGDHFLVDLDSPDPIV